MYANAAVGSKARGQSAIGIHTCGSEVGLQDCAKALSNTLVQPIVWTPVGPLLHEWQLQKHSTMILV